uniref:Uncharacterized protein n=1 Tax=Romanomermis culicivorax TaxID=13658 RepID=A0A915K676_ROMCU
MLNIVSQMRRLRRRSATLDTASAKMDRLMLPLRHTSQMTFRQRPTVFWAAQRPLWPTWCAMWRNFDDASSLTNVFVVGGRWRRLRLAFPLRLLAGRCPSALNNGRGKGCQATRDYSKLLIIVVGIRVQTQRRPGRSLIYWCRGEAGLPLESPVAKTTLALDKRAAPGG